MMVRAPRQDNCDISRLNLSSPPASSVREMDKGLQTCTRGTPRCPHSEPHDRREGAMDDCLPASSCGVRARALNPIAVFGQAPLAPWPAPL